MIRTPDQRVRVFVSSTLGELAPERAAVRAAIERLRLVPVLFELGARPHPPRELYRAYLQQSHVFVGLYWQRYGWVAPGETVSGLEDEFRMGAALPGLFYLKEPAPDREPRLQALLDELRSSDRASYRRFGDADELAEMVTQDLAVLLSERFVATTSLHEEAPSPAAPPVPLASLVGREEEQAELAALLREGARLVTITGAGGIGKTRLALAVGGALHPSVPDGVHVVPLGDVEDVELVLPTIADRLGVRLGGTDDAARALETHLRERHLVLVLDNLEQVAGAATALRGLLERCPGLQVLATSRVPLGIVGELERRLEPLRLAGANDDLDAVRASPAVELFVQRARAVVPTFRLDDGTAPAVAALVRRLDGLPLAIELAAARIRLFPPAQLLERLGERLDVLSGSRDRPDRHRTLRATVDWSLRLLDDPTRRSFARLAVFADGATLDAIEDVCDLEGSGDVLEHLGQLVDHGLVQLSPAGPEQPRARLLGPVRMVAQDHLTTLGEDETLRRRHLRYYAGLADRAQPHLCGPDQLRWMGLVEPERANLRAAAEAGLALGEEGTVLELGFDVLVHYHLVGAQQEPAAWIERAARRADRLDERQRAVARCARGITALRQGDHTAARPELTAALDTFRARDLPFEMAVTEMHLAGCDLADGAWGAAATWAEQAAARFGSVGHDWGVGSCEQLVGLAEASRGDVGAARAALERSLAAGERIENLPLTAQTLTALAELALATGDVPTAARHLGRAVTLLERVHDMPGVAACLEAVAGVALARGAATTARVSLTAASATRYRIGVPAPTWVAERVAAVADASPEEGSGDGRDPFDVLAEVASVLDGPTSAVDSGGEPGPARRPGSRRLDVCSGETG